MGGCGRLGRDDGCVGRRGGDLAGVVVVRVVHDGADGGDDGEERRGGNPAPSHQGWVGGGTRRASSMVFIRPLLLAASGNGPTISVPGTTVSAVTSLGSVVAS